jgi:hypothetical protein
MNQQKYLYKGSVSVEYVVATGTIIAVLFLPLAGESGSVVNMVIDAMKHFQANTLYLLSMP